MDERPYRNPLLQQAFPVELGQLPQKSWQERLREEEQPRRKKKGYVRRNGR